MLDANNDPVNAQPAAVTINGEVDCIDQCAGATYDGNPDGNANDAPTDGDQAPNADDDDRSDPDGSCVIPQGQSQCTFTYDRNDEGNDEVTFWVAGHASEDEDPGVEDQDDTDAVTKEWQDREATNIDCGPENEVNQTNQPHTVTCTTTDQFGQPVNSGNTAADDDTAFDQTGGSPTVQNEDNTADNNGQSSVTFTDDQPGTVTTTGCIDQNDNNVCDAGEPQDATTKEFQAGDAEGLDAFPETDTNTVGQQHSITCQVFNQFGNANNAEGTNNQTCNFEFFDGSPSDQDDNSPNTPDRACTTDASGDCTITYTSNATGTDRVCVWLGGTTAAMTGDNTNGTCGGEGLEDPSAGTESGNAADTPDPANDDQDVVEKVWTAGAGAATQVDAEPETDTNPVSTAPCHQGGVDLDPPGDPNNVQNTGCSSHTIGVSARDANNNETTATPILADIRPGSPNASQQTAQAEVQCAPDANNVDQAFTPNTNTETHECTYTSNGTAGTDIIWVFADTNNNGIFDQGEPFDEVRKTWSGQVFALAMTEGDTATAGTCNEFTVTLTDVNGNPVAGQVVDVRQVLQSAGNDPSETRELAFCNPNAAQGPNPTGQGNTTFTPHDPDATTNPQGGNVGPTPGANTAVQAEVGPTNNNGQVTFGITINEVPVGQTATVNVRSWVDTGGDNDVFDAGEPTDTATKTWTPGGGGAVTGLNAEPESATNPVGTQHQVTVTLTGASGALPGITPSSVIVSNAAGRPAGDVADPNAGTSPNAGSGGFTAYNCTPSNAQGISTCTFQDQAPLTTGTDTIVFYVNQASGGTAGPDVGEPQDAVQKTWTTGPQNLAIDLQCSGAGQGDDLDVGENPLGNQPGGTAENNTADCTNPVSDQDEVFTAIVTTQQGIGQQNVRVDFSFGTRTNGNQANNSTNDATLNSGAGGGGQVGTAPPGLQTFCLTDATGRCSVTLTNPTPVAGDAIDVTATISGQTQPNPAGTSDTATKAWQGATVSRVTLTPRAATNQVGTQHTVTATVLNQFGQPVQGANVDFRITAGPNAGLAQAGMIDAVTNAAGQATFTYTSNAVGTDTIQACTETGGTENDTCNPGEPSANAFKTWQTGPVQTSGVALDMDADENGNVNSSPAGLNNNPPALGCELTTSGADANRESSASNQINTTQGGQLNLSNFHRICAAAFQSGQQANSGRLAGAQITFTISGPGRIFAANANGQCATNAQPPAGTTVTVTADENGYAFACLYSQQVGRTTVTASSGTPAQTATGTKDWTVDPSTARFIQLCHGDVAGTTCDTAPARNAPGDEHQMTARVTDAQGNPVANVPVQFRETGPAIFTPQGGSTATVNTDANGLASVLMVSDVEGTSTVVAEISPPGTAGGFRGPGQDECERPAGTNNQPAAGNCISQTLTKQWAPDPPEFQCDDGADNDNDGNIDFPEDQGCDSETDNSEFPVDPPPPPEKVRHDRRISIRFNDGTGARNNGLVVFGRVRLGPDGTNPDCIAQVPVNVQRRVNGRWVTKKTTTTNRRGRYAVEIFDQASRYRAVAPRVEIPDEDLNQLHICRKAVKAKRHRHRR